MECFIYDWNVFTTYSNEFVTDKYTRQTTRKRSSVDTIYAFGVDKANKSVLLKIPFLPYCHVMLPDGISEDQIRLVQSALRKYDVVQMTVVERHRLYGAHLTPDGSQRRLFTFLKCYFKCKWDIRTLASKIDDVSATVEMKLAVHDVQADPVLQLITTRHLNTCGWLYTGKDVQPLTRPESLCDREYQVTWQQLEKVATINVPKLVIAAFDIECVSEDRVKFPDAKMPNDVCFQISIVFSDGVQCLDRHLLTLGRDVHVDGCSVTCYESEAKLLIGFAQFIRQHNIQIMMGYNIFMFDIPYLIERSKQNQCFDEFCRQSVFCDRVCKVEHIKWYSSAYATQEYMFLNAEGRVFVDLQPVIQKEYKLENYKLDTVAKKFLDECKNDLPVSEIFACYDRFTSESLGLCGSYCVQDSALVVKLFLKLKIFYSLQGMANVCCVPTRTLLLRGQQIKVFSQIYQYCVDHRFTVEKPDYPRKANERYAGAYVFDPVPGLYENVVPFDFASLYPTTIIAYNIDYSTIVFDDSIPDSQCHVMQWKDHFDCPKECDGHGGSTCIPRRYRFLKSVKGVLPSIIDNLLTARKNTRALMKDQSDPFSLMILNQQQLALKVSANSMYGITGTREGMLPLVPLAMCVTFMGRVNVKKAARIITNDYGGRIVYGDTDSNYIIFPHIPLDQLYDYSNNVSANVSAQFENPIYLEFENTVYAKFLIFTKKRYVYQSMRADLTIDPKLGQTGVLLARRDTFRYLKETYKTVVDKSFANCDRRDILDYVTDRLAALLCRRVIDADFFMTKSFNHFDELSKDEDGSLHLGHYKVKQKGDDEQDYVSQLPAVCQLVDRMRQRGDFNVQGNRIDYVILAHPDKHAKQAVKIEHVDYFLSNRHACRLDYFFYFERMVEPMDQLIFTLFKLPDWTKSFFILHHRKKLNMLLQIKKLGAPVFKFK